MRRIDLTYPSSSALRFDWETQIRDGRLHLDFERAQLASGERVVLQVAIGAEVLPGLTATVAIADEGSLTLALDANARTQLGAEIERRWLAAAAAQGTPLIYISGPEQQPKDGR
jgi:hypothetical protein